MGATVSKRSDAPHIVALGGGYASIYLYRELERWLRRGRVRLTVVDKNNYHCFHGLVPELLVGKIQPGTILSPLRRLLKHANFVNGLVSDVDLDQQSIRVSRSLDGKEFEIGYDHLVVALGSSEDPKRFPGALQHALALKSFPDILQTKHRLITMLELAEIERDPEEVARLLSIVVAGGNYAGVEVASELAEFLPRIAKDRFPNIPTAMIRVHLVHSGDRVLPELGVRHPKLQAYTQDALHASECVNIVPRTRLAMATAEEAILDDGRRIPTRTIINCTGTASAPILNKFSAERDPSGRLVTDQYCRIPGRNDLWAAGDCSAVPHPDGGTCPPLAIWAMMAGAQVGRNIKATVAGRDLEPYRFTGLGDACTLGSGRAVGHLKGIPVTGRMAHAAWRFLMMHYLPSPEKKVRLLLDWFLKSGFGNDLVNMNIDRPLAVTPVLFEAGQDVVREGEIGQGLYFIRSGEVEVLRRSGDDSSLERIRVMRPGDHFGEVAVFRRVRRTATVRALTRVELLHLRGEAALALSEAKEQIARALANPAASEYTPKDVPPIAAVQPSGGLAS